MYKLEEKGMGGSHGGKVSFNPLAGHIVSTEWEKPKGDLGRISPLVGKESDRKKVPFRKMTKAEKIIKLIDNPGSNQDVDFFGARF